MAEGFHPTNPTVTIALTVASAGSAVPRNGGGSYRFVNNSAAVVFVRVAAAAGAATNADLPIGPNSTEVFRFPQGQEAVSAILASGTGNLYVTPGEGF